ncbi:MAG TPA: rhodanese-like domain-containing protein [Polyangiaceae bacterium]|jgi:rhodanese-related sulfurtransferase
MIHPILRLSALMILGGACALACSKAPATGSAATNEAKPTIPEVTVAQVASYVKDKSATIFDANDADTRQKFGVVPGAVLLSGHKDYPLSELPAAKATKLVFYCGGTQCRASDAAASRAATAGYSDVSVMRDGIRGWKTAGQPTSAAPQS